MGNLPAGTQSTFFFVLDYGRFTLCKRSRRPKQFLRNQFSVQIRVYTVAIMPRLVIIMLVNRVAQKYLFLIYLTNLQFLFPFTNRPFFRSLLWHPFQVIPTSFLSTDCDEKDFKNGSPCQLTRPSSTFICK